MSLFGNRTFQKRYFVVDFDKGYLTYRKKKDAQQTTILLFRELVSCSCVNQPWMQGSKERTQQFSLTTVQREYNLLAASETERIIWMDIFNLIVAITPFRLQEKLEQKKKSFNVQMPNKNKL